MPYDVSFAEFVEFFTCFVAVDVCCNIFFRHIICDDFIVDFDSEMFVVFNEHFFDKFDFYPDLLEIVCVYIVSNVLIVLSVYSVFGIELIAAVDVFAFC